ncbi:MAG: hypothetical protein QXT45_06735 [Candidatus Bilamarchaeaceae archaeon]
MGVTEVLSIVNSPVAWMPGWVSLLGLALMTSTSILAFAYFWSILFRNPQMTAMVKMELWEVVVSVVIVVFIFGIVAWMQTLEVSAIYPPSLFQSGGLPAVHRVSPDATFYEATEIYFLRVRDDMLGWIDAAYAAGIEIDLIASLTPYTRPLSIGFVSKPFAGIGMPLKQLLGHATIGVVIAYLINYAQYFTFLFVLDGFLRYYLPIGVFLRCFTPTRRVGGGIIAIAASFLVIFPILCTTTYVIFYSEGSPMLTFWDFIRSIPQQLDNLNQEMYRWLFGGQNPLWEILFFPFAALIGFIEVAFGTVFMVVLGLTAGIIARAFLIGYIMPTFNVFMLIQTAKSLSKSLGEEIDISALTRLI